MRKRSKGIGARSGVRARKQGKQDTRPFFRELYGPPLRRARNRGQLRRDAGRALGLTWGPKFGPARARTWSYEERSEMMKKRWANATPEERALFGARMRAGRKPEHFAAGGRATKGGIWKTMTQDERIEYARRLHAAREAKRREAWRANPPKVVNTREPFDFLIANSKERNSWRNSLRNPFPVKLYGREEALAKYEAYARSTPRLLKRIFRIQPGTRLGCHCKPLACHGDVIVKLWLELRCEHGKEKI